MFISLAHLIFGRAVGERGGEEMDDSKYSTCVLHADAQYFRRYNMKLKGGKSVVTGCWLYFDAIYTSTRTRSVFWLSHKIIRVPLRQVLVRTVVYNVLWLRCVLLYMDRAVVQDIIFQSLRAAMYRHDDYFLVAPYTIATKNARYDSYQVLF